MIRFLGKVAGAVGISKYALVIPSVLTPVMDPPPVIEIVPTPVIELSPGSIVTVPDPTVKTPTTRAFPTTVTSLRIDPPTPMFPVFAVVVVSPVTVRFPDTVRFPNDEGATTSYALYATTLHYHYLLKEYQN